MFNFGYFLRLNILSLGLCEGTGVCPPLPANLEGSKQRIITALQTVDHDMRQRFLEELEYRINVYRVSGGAHIEDL